MSLVETIQGFIDQIEAGERVKLPEAEGRSSYKVRHLLNMLAGKVATHYLEIGLRSGSTFIPAIYGNQTPATGIDNWCEPLNWRPVFYAYLEMHKLMGDRVQIIEQDAWDVDLKEVRKHGGPVDVYFYDGDHNPLTRAQFKAIDYYLPVLTNEFVYIVDDANYPTVKELTYEAIAKNSIKIVKEWRLPGKYDGGPDDWWNGLLVLVCQK